MDDDECIMFGQPHLSMAVDILFKEGLPDDAAESLFQLQETAFALKVIVEVFRRDLSVNETPAEDLGEALASLEEHLFRLSVGIDRLVAVQDRTKLDRFENQILKSVVASRDIGVFLLRFMAVRE